MNTISFFLLPFLFFIFSPAIYRYDLKKKNHLSQSSVPNTRISFFVISTLEGAGCGEKGELNHAPAWLTIVQVKYSRIMHRGASRITGEAKQNTLQEHNTGRGHALLT